MTAAGVAWRQAVGAFHRLPQRFRTTPIEMSEALRILRCGADGLLEIADAGLAIGTGDGGSPVFDRYEIMNLGWSSGSRRSLPELCGYFLRPLANSPATRLTEPHRWAVTVTAGYRPCPQCTVAERCVVTPTDVADKPRVDGWTGWRVRFPPAAAGGDSLPRRQVELTGDVELSGQLAVVRNRAARDAFDAIVTDFRYQFLPPAMRVQLDVLLTHRAVDCVGAAHLMRHWLGERGVASRVRYGLLMLPVGSGAHAWVEFDDDDGLRKALDPTLVMMAGATADSQLAGLLCGSSVNVLLPLASVPGGEAVVVHRCPCCDPELSINVSAR